MNHVTLDEATRLSEAFGLPLDETISPEAIARSNLSDRMQIIAMAYGQEVQLENISSGLSLSIKLASLHQDPVKTKIEISTAVKSLLQSLGLDESTGSSGNIHSIMPLLLSFNMSREESHYLTPSIQKVFRDKFLEIISHLNITLDSLKDRYIDENPLNSIQPIKLEVDKYLLELKVDNSDNLVGFPKMWFHLRSLGGGFLWLIILTLILIGAAVLPKGVIKLIYG